MKPSDISAAVELKDLEGWNQTVADWEFMLRASPESCFVAECEGDVIGTTAAIMYGSQVGWVGMVVVRADRRGEGIGTRLLKTALGHLDRKGLKCVKLDATSAGRPLYEKLGFVAEYNIERWSLQRAQEAFQAAHQVSTASKPHIEAVLQMDATLFGSDRSVVLRSVAHGEPDYFLTKVENDQVLGYSLGRRGSLADQLGPWTAISREVATGLLDNFLTRSARDMVIVDCVQSNPWAIDLLNRRGFQFSRALTRMFRGDNTSPGHPELYCSILGPEFG
jgi:GNAT superfamily N-acetyltransferase